MLTTKYLIFCKIVIHITYQNKTLFKGIYIQIS